MGLLDSFGFDNIELWRSEEMQLVQVCCWQELPGGVQPATRLHVSTASMLGTLPASGTHADGGVSAYRAVQHSMKITPVCGAALTADDPSRVSTRHHRCSR